MIYVTLVALLEMMKIKMKKKIITITKLLFFVVILAIVAHSIIGIAHDVNGQQLKQGLKLLNAKSFIMLTIIGFISLLPMLIYDFVLVKILKIHKTVTSVASIGLFVNTLNNLLGFSGLIGIGLRYVFYKKDVKSKNDIKYGLTKLAIFLMSGLSISSWLALIILIQFHQYNLIWMVSLIIAGCYTPIVLTYTKLSHNQNMQLPNQISSILMLGSFLEWIGCSITFISIGYALNLIHNPLYVFAIFIVANVLGIISMIPGGLGMFESIIISGLANNNVNLILIWLLLYRLFYYLIPIAISSLIIVIHQIINRKKV